MTVTVIIDVNTQRDAPSLVEIREEIERLLAASTRGWLYKIWRAEQWERER